VGVALLLEEFDRKGFDRGFVEFVSHTSTPPGGLSSYRLFLNSFKVCPFIRAETLAS
jgi:hypothetical protein